MPDEINWDPLRALARRVLQEGETFVLTSDVHTLLERTASEVGIRDADAARALLTEEGALELLRESARRIHDGSWRVTRALHQMYRHQQAGDYDSARQEMRNVLAVEVVPLYREIAQDQLDDMADQP
ncbi:hypothetical protein MFUL124B02_04435 [Myxococcus fulvus 124B02]|nr:hypothetical protein MFUL124B02_04435 [Myxococcus fulvus 124B02]